MTIIKLTHLTFADAPRVFMMEYLEELESSRVSKYELPSLFDDANIDAVFTLMDPTNQGTITMDQYHEGSMNQRVQKYNFFIGNS